MKYKITGDYIFNGAVAGLTGGIIQTIYAIIIKSLNISPLEFIDYAELLIMGRDYAGVATIVGIIAHLINASVWGVIFSVIMRIGKPMYFITKGIGLGIFIWLFSLGLATLVKLKEFQVIPPRIAVTLLIGAVLWGIIMSYVYKRLQKRNPSFIK